MNEEAKTKKLYTKFLVIIIILLLVVFGLSGYIIYDKVLSSAKMETDKVEKTDDDSEDMGKIEEEKAIDLSSIPNVESECTFEFTTINYNSFDNKTRHNDVNCGGRYKYIINDIVVDGKKLMFK